MFTLAFIYASLCMLLFIYQRDLLYFPTAKFNHIYPSEIFQHGQQSIDVITLNKGHKKAIIFFGGNRETVAKGAADHINNFPEYTIFLVNYRGYGNSSGSPEEQAIYTDALHIYDKITDHYANISVIGRSLGTGVATYLSAHRNIEKMVLITPYDSVENIAKSRYPMFPISLLITDKFDSLGRVNKIKAQTLIILAENDKDVPFKNSLRLINAFPSKQITVEIIKGAGHNSLLKTREFNRYLRDFMK